MLNRHWQLRLGEPAAVAPYVWAVAIPRGESSGEEWLSERERLLAHSFAGTPRAQEWLQGRIAAKKALAAATGYAPTAWEVLVSSDGRPVPVCSFAAPGEAAALPLSALSISHSRTLVVAAVTTLAGARLGVDVCDVADAVRVRRIKHRVLSEDERHLLGPNALDGEWALVWAMKEAALKMSGGGVFAPGLAAVRLLSLSPPKIAGVDEVLLGMSPACVVALAMCREAGRH